MTICFWGKEVKVIVRESQQWLLGEIYKYVEDVDRRYAIAVEGPWGCGKTRFLNMVLAPSLKRKKKRMVRVSMFGLKTGDQLYEKIGATLLRLEGERSDKSTKFMRQVAINTPKFAASALAVKGVSLQFDIGMKFAVDMIASSKHVIVLDDVERRSQDSDDLSLFGAVNELVESYGLKVILVTNRLQDDNKGRSFDLNVQEKLVWKRYSYEQSFSELLDGIYNHIDVSIPGIDSLGCVREAVERSGCVNARAMLKVELLVSDLLRLDVFRDDSIYLINRKSALVDIVQLALMLCDGNVPQPPRSSNGEGEADRFGGEKWRMQQQYEFYLDLRFVEQYFRPRAEAQNMDLEGAVRRYIGTKYSETAASHAILAIKSAIDSEFRGMSDGDVQGIVDDLSSQICSESFASSLLRPVVYWYEEFRDLGFDCVLSREELILHCQHVMLSDLEGAIEFSNYPHTSLPCGEEVDSIYASLSSFAISAYQQRVSEEVAKCLSANSSTFDLLNFLSSCSLNRYRVLLSMDVDELVTIFNRSNGDGQLGIIRYLKRVHNQSSIPAGVCAQFSTWLLDLKRALQRCTSVERMDALRMRWFIRDIDDLLPSYFPEPEE